MRCVEQACGTRLKKLNWIRQQKWSSCSWLLLREFVKIRQEQEQELIKDAEASGNEDALEGTPYLPLPTIPYVSLSRLAVDRDIDIYACGSGGVAKS